MAVDNNIKDRSNESAKRAKQLPEGVQYAIVKVLPNILNGCFWGFSDASDIQKHIEVIRQDRNIIARKLENACLIEVNPQYLVKAIQLIDPKALTVQDLDTMQKARIDATEEMRAFLIRRGKKNERFAGTIGIYCTNDTSNILFKGVNYPAFRVDFNTALQLLAQCNYGIKVNGQFLTAQQAQQTGQALWDSAKLSPTSTGIFIDIQYMGTPEQAKQLEAQMKAR